MTKIAFLALFIFISTSTIAGLTGGGNLNMVSTEIDSDDISIIYELLDVISDEKFGEPSLYTVYWEEGFVIFNDEEVLHFEELYQYM